MDCRDCIFMVENSLVFVALLQLLDLLFGLVWSGLYGCSFKATNCCGYLFDEAKI